MNLAQLKADLIEDEGSRLKPYRDTVGKVSIGIGRNLTDVGISSDEEDLMYRNDVQRVMTQLDRALPWWNALPEPAARVLANMTFNMGLGGVLQFKTTLQELREHRFKDAADSLLHSAVARQLPNRYGRLAALLRSIP